MIEQVFVDMDGVLNKFSTYALQYVGAIDRPMKYHNYPANCCTWDIVQSANYLRPEGTPKYTNSSFWDALDRTFWATIPIESYALEMLDFLQRKVGAKYVCIASTPTLSAECLAGKMDWIYRFLPRWIHRQYMFGRDKHLLAHADTLLIDDNQDNCDKFNRWGGDKILVPRPWNRYRELSAKIVLSDDLNYFLGERPWPVN
jgi:5'(3')-deoxyribonucleotidase